MMAKPLEERSDEELKRGLEEGEFGDKKAVVAQEMMMISAACFNEVA